MCLKKTRDHSASDLLQKVEIQPNGCWLFTGSLNREGYGTWRLNGKTYLVHRLSHELVNGPIPSEVPLDHTVGACSFILRRSGGRSEVTSWRVSALRVIRHLIPKAN